MVARVLLVVLCYITWSTVILMPSSVVICKRPCKVVKKCICLDTFSKYDGRSLRAPAAAPAAAAAASPTDTPCSSWRPDQVYVQPDYAQHSVQVWLDAATRPDIEVGLIRKDRKDVFTSYQQVSSDSNLKSVLFRNITSGTYIVVYRPIGCFDCTYADYYSQPCDTDYISTAPFVFHVQQAGHVLPVVQSTPAHGETSSKAGSDRVLLWLMLGACVAVVCASGCIYWYVSRAGQYKKVSVCEEPISKTKDVVLIYSKDNADHFGAVEAFAALLTKAGKNVIYPDDPRVLTTIRQDVNTWADSQARRNKTTTMFVTLFSEPLNQVCKVMDSDQRAYETLCNSVEDPFKWVAPRILKYLKENAAHILLIDFGYMQDSVSGHTLKNITSHCYTLTINTMASSLKGSNHVHEKINIKQMISMFTGNVNCAKLLGSEEAKTFSRLLNKIKYLCVDSTLV